VWLCGYGGDGGLQALEILAAVERLDAEAFRRAPHELLVKVRAFEVGNDFVLPLLSGYRRKILL